MDHGLTLQAERGSRRGSSYDTVSSLTLIEQCNSEQELKVQEDYEQKGLQNHLLVGREL